MPRIGPGPDINPDLLSKPDAGEVPCKRCGSPTTALGAICAPCLNADYVRQQLKWVRDILRAEPKRQIVLARDERLVQHLVLFNHAGLAWCGQKVTEKLGRRRAAQANKLPAGVCALCLERLKEVSDADPEKAPAQ